MIDSRLLAIATAGLLLVAPAAFAQGASTGATSNTGTNKGMSGMNMNTPNQGSMATMHGVTAPFLLMHAYTEAVHANQALALGMPEMARNHMSNVNLSLGAVQDAQLPNNQIRTSVQQLRDRAGRLGSTTSAPETAKLVAQFATLFDQAPSMLGGGGGQGKMTNMTATMLTPVGLMVDAQDSAVKAQSDAALGNFQGASLHAQHAVLALSTAIVSARSKGGAGATIQQLTTLRGDAQRIATLAGQRSPQTVSAAGRLVTLLAGLPSGTTGGGAGTGAGNQPSNSMQR